MTRSDVICWVDLETTGSELNTNKIIEIGMALTTATPDLTVLRTFKQVHQPAYWDVIYKPQMVPIVVEMHTDNGLIVDVDNAEHHSYAEGQYDKLDEEINEFLGLGYEHIPLAGSGVSHFDRGFIRRDLPRFDKRLTYWAYDVGSVRRFARLAGAMISPPDKGLSHRALDDVLDHIEESRRYLTLFKSTTEAT